MIKLLNCKKRWQKRNCMVSWLVLTGLLICVVVDIGDNCDNDKLIIVLVHHVILRSPAVFLHCSIFASLWTSWWSRYLLLLQQLSMCSKLSTGKVTKIKNLGIVGGQDVKKVHMRFGHLRKICWYKLDFCTYTWYASYYTERSVLNSERF